MSKEISVKKRLWRTLIRVVEVDQEANCFYVILPGWSVSERVKLCLDDVPDEVREKLKPVYRLHAQVNIGVDLQKDLVFRDWETR